MDTTLETYRGHRDVLLGKIVDTFSRDERFAAGWLTGSFGRGDNDSISDIDICIVVSDPYAETFCRRLDQAMSQTSPERYSLFCQFGTPALIHENNNNAPAGGTFTFVLYADSAVMVDWTMIPQLKAVRPHPSKLLFNKVNLPGAALLEADDLEHSRRSVAGYWAFFWMMTAITIKYMIRGDDVFAVHWIENLHGIVREVERQMDRQPWSYHRGSISTLPATRAMQIHSLQDLCRKMQRLKHRISEFTGLEAAAPFSEIDLLFSLLKS